MNSYERKRRICKMIVLVLGILSINNIILTIRNYSYAYFEKNVKTGVKLKITTLDEMPSKYAIDIIKNTVVSNITDTCVDFNTKGGLVAINTDGTLYQEDSGQEIREYRYVGPDVDNYVYFNCQDDTTISSNTCEVWRIIGIFKDEFDNEHLKIVSNGVLSEKKQWNSISKNDWENSSLKEYLNTKYYGTLNMNAKDMIEETKYYLGNYKYSDTAISGYVSERGSTACSGSSWCNNGDIWQGNQATWKGNIALMYSSDYAYTENSCNWKRGIINSSWVQTTVKSWGSEFLLSPSSTGIISVTGFDFDNNDVRHVSVTNTESIRPCLYLKSEVKITDGDGSSTTPYYLSVE